MSQSNRPDPPSAVADFAAAVDAALATAPMGRSLLPLMLHTDYDRVVSAFDCLHRNDPAAAREAVQPIGLASPFLDWKLLVRGLVAFYTDDPVRAIENWQRLHPQRLPARLASPYRVMIDPAYRQNLPKALADKSCKAAMRLARVAVCEKLRDCLSEINSAQGVTNGLRALEKYWPTICEQMPQQLQRLAQLCYAAIVHAGRASDIPLYAKIFAAPADDPGLQRLTALEAELSGNFGVSTRAWQAYVAQIDQFAHRSDDEKRMAKSLVWERLAVNAQNFLDQLSNDPNLSPEQKLLLTSQYRSMPVQCWKKAIQATPGRRKPTLEYLRLADPISDPDYEPIAQQLLAVEPDNAIVLSLLGQQAKTRGNYPLRLDYVCRAFAAQPGNAQLAQQVRLAICELARHQSSQKQYPQALETLTLLEQLRLPVDVVVLILRSLLAQRLRQAGLAERALAQAKSLPDCTPLLLAVVQLAEAIMLKVTPAHKKQLQAELAAALAVPLDPRGSLPLADYLAQLSATPRPFVGYQTLRRKVCALFEQACTLPYDDVTTATQIALGVLRLRLSRHAAKLGLRLEQLSPNHPAVPLLSAISLQGTRRCVNVARLFESARNRLAVETAVPLRAELAQMLDELAREWTWLNRQRLSHAVSLVELLGEQSDDGEGDDE